MNPALQALIDRQRQESFTDPEKATDAKALGILISKHFEWSGVPILETAYAALEDANFHTEAGRVADILEAERQR